MKYLFLILLMLLSCQEPKAAEELLGRYENKDGELIHLKMRRDKIVFHPARFRSSFSIKSQSNDHYILEFRPSVQLFISRDDAGKISQVNVRGFPVADSIFHRLDAKDKSGTDELFAGNGKDAAQLFNASSIKHERILEIASTVYSQYPSKRKAVQEFLIDFEIADKHKAAYHSLLANTYVWQQNRDLAATHFKTAYSLDPENASAINGLQKLNVLDRPDGWTVPFDLKDALKDPSLEEIAAVKQDWQNRDLSGKDVETILSEDFPYGEKKHRLHIITHTVHGSKHYAAILVPKEIKSNTPLIIESKGTNWRYSPRNLNRAVKSFGMLEDRQSDFVIIIPSFRGEVIQYKGVDYISEGDRSRGWDGASDDAIALLSVAFGMIPEIDPNRIISFGASRGGTVAMLSGMRDSRITHILAWAGPTDWFRLMTYGGWRQDEIMTYALAHKSRPQDEGGQFIERFLAPAVRGEHDLNAVRHHLISGSPLYFSDMLKSKKLQVHYGIEDRMVPIANGYELAEQMKKYPDASFEAFFHQGSGHDLDAYIALTESRRFIDQLLKDSK